MACGCLAAVDRVVAGRGQDPLLRDGFRAEGSCLRTFAYHIVVEVSQVDILIFPTTFLFQDEKILPTGYTANAEGMLRYQYQVSSPHYCFEYSEGDGSRFVSFVVLFGVSDCVLDGDVEGVELRRNGDGSLPAQTLIKDTCLLKRHSACSSALSFQQP